MAGNIGNPIDQSGAVKPSSLEQQVYEPDLFAQRITEIPSNMQMFTQKDANKNFIYIGYAAKGIQESDDGWLIHKFTYDVDNDIVKRQSAYGSWDGRADLTYE